MPTIAGQHGAMIVAGLLAAAAADDCCWFARSRKGTTFEKPRQAIAACDTKHLCFVACSTSRRRVAQTYYKERIAPKACTCDPNQVAREANFSSPPKTPVSRSLRAVYAGAFLAPYKVAARVDWRGLAGEPLDAANNGVLREASAVWRPAHPESIRVMHLSAYELGVVARHSYAEATHCGAWTRSSNGSLEICAVRRRGGGRATTVRLRSSPSSAACGSTAWRRGRSRREP